MESDVWNFEYQAPVAERLLTVGILGVTIKGRLWWNGETWAGIERQGPCSNYDKSVKSFKAFKRYLRKHDYLKGQEVLLSSEYIGHDITARWQEPNSLNRKNGE